MPFMIGVSPIRRTKKYLEMGKIIFRENVKVFSINYNTKGEHHAGAREFIFWHLPQIQYKNPNVQCITFTNMTPSPFIKLFLEGGKKVLIDIDSRQKDDILLHLQNFTAVCKTKKEISEIIKQSKIKSNPSYFGIGCERHCICEIFGQVPCPAIVHLPEIWRGIPEKNPKYRIPPYYLPEPGLEVQEKEDE